MKNISGSIFVNINRFSIIFTLGILMFLSGCSISIPFDEEEIPYDESINDQDNDIFINEQILFNEVFQKLLDHHYKEVTEEQLWYAAMMGLITSLNDPFTQYFDAQRYNSFRQNYKESFVGIGVSVENYLEKPLIRTVWPGSPAERVGILPGDTIMSVDGVIYQTFYETIGAMLDEEGTEVTIEVLRPDVSELISFTMIRELIANPSVEGEILAGDIGYLAIRSFGDQTATLVNNYLNDFETTGIDGLIIDLRNNGGGSLSTLNALLNLFLYHSDDSLPFYTLQIYQEGEWSSQSYYGNTGSPRAYEIVVLINGYSASASEVFAAAMNEVGGYSLIGENTYGKGTLQTSMPLTSQLGDYLHVTIGKWLTPTNEWVNNDGGTNGVIPTIEIAQNPYFFIPSIHLLEEESFQYDQVSPIIQRVQMILNALGYDNRFDGYFDTGTEVALLDFQMNHELELTGKIDYETALMLSSALYAYRLVLENDHQLMVAYYYLLGIGE